MKTDKRTHAAKKDAKLKQGRSAKAPVSTANRKKKQIYKGIKNSDEGSLE